MASPANSIAFVFDQNIDPLSATLTNFKTGWWYSNAAGNFCFSTTARQVNATTIVATFPTVLGPKCNDTILPAPSVANARRASVLDTAVESATGTDAPLTPPNEPQGTNMPSAANAGRPTSPA